jgi:hypothetical protein
MYNMNNKTGEGKLAIRDAGCSFFSCLEGFIHPGDPGDFILHL